MNKDLSYYQQIPYTKRCQLCVEDGDWFWVVWIEELAGCKVQGESKAEAYLHLQELFEDYISALLERGSEIPEPVAQSPAITPVQMAGLLEPLMQHIVLPKIVSSSLGVASIDETEETQTALVGSL